MPMRPAAYQPSSRGALSWLSAFAILVALVMLCAVIEPARAAAPNIVLVMADDMGWGQTGYYNHPVLQTPNLDAMASNGLRFDRFYAGGPVCSPTRASVLTGRAHDRTGVLQHGYALRLQETTIAQLVRDAGYVTGHFGKWHLNGLRGPGVPILASDDHHPGHFGFDHWLSVTNFFDRDPILSRGGDFEEFEGDSSEIVVEQALRFVSEQAEKQKPFFAVIWYGTPHSPFKASDEDMRPFADLDENSKHHYGELVAMDRSVGALRRRLRELNIANDTLFWFCSDNGGLPKIEPDTVGGLRGNKGSIYEGGLRVPGIIEWPGRIQTGRIANHPASVLDILPTILDILDVQFPIDNRPLDGVSLLNLIDGDDTSRRRPIPFRYMGALALVDNDFKLLRSKKSGGKFQLYHLRDDPAETADVSGEHPAIAKRMQEQLLDWNDSVEASYEGKDYPEGRVDPDEPEPRFWTDVDDYKPYFPQWKNRWEYASRLAPAKKKKGKSK